MQTRKQIEDEYEKIQDSAWAERIRKLEELEQSEIITVKGKRYQLIKK